MCPFIIRLPLTSLWFLPTFSFRVATEKRRGAVAGRESENIIAVFHVLAKAYDDCDAA
jgi:hypothetical protein